MFRSSVVPLRGAPTMKMGLLDWRFPGDNALIPANRSLLYAESNVGAGPSR
jgi:hypothetical protein